MAIIKGQDMVTRLMRLFQRRGDVTDAGVFGEASDSLEEVVARLRDNVERTGNPAKGSITITLNLKAERTHNAEVVVNLSSSVTTKKPALPGRTAMVWLDPDCALHTVPVQENLPLDGPMRAIQGGKGEDEKKEKVSK